MREVMQDVKDLFDQDMTADAKKLMQQHSLGLPQMGFGFVRNVYELYFPDRLHQSNRGTPEEVARLLEQSLQPAQKKALNGYLSSLPRFPNLKVPSFGLDTGKKTTATKTADLCKVLPVAILAFASVRATFLEPMQELLEFMTLRDLKQHPDAS
ncbi:TPA: hypothetical protein ACH3X1_001266 [Trebouxia sp. C0004]